MGRRRATALKEKKRKKVNIKLVEREHAGKVVTPYRIIEGLIADVFTELVDARVAFAWNYSAPKEDGDGQVKMYAVKKGTDLDRNREFTPFDFVIIFSHDLWNMKLSDDEMVAAMHEALCHCAVVLDKNGDPQTDEMNLPVFRLRKPTVKTFPENVARFGLWRPEVNKLFERAKDFNDSKRPLLKGINDKPSAEPGKKFSEPAFGSNGHSNGHVPLPGQKELPIVKDTLPPAIKKRMTSTPAKAAAKKTAKPKAGAKKKK